MKSLVMLVLAAGTLRASSPTDLDLLKTAVGRALADYTLKGAVGKLALVNDGVGDDNLFVRDALFATFHAQGIEVFYDALPDTAAFELACRVTDLGVYYQQRFKKIPWGQSYVKRFARARFQLVLSKNRQILDTQDLAGECADVVPEADLPLLRSKQFTHEETLTTRTSLWEPLLVAAIVGLLVLAFYGPQTF